MNEQIITALDIGSHKIFAVSGLLTDSGLQVIGNEVIYPSQEVVKYGRVVDMDSLTNELYELFERMAQTLEERIKWVVIGVGGGHVQGCLHQKKIKIEPHGREITASDIEELEQAIKTEIATSGNTERKILHLLPQEYIVDCQSPTRKAPLGLHAHTLEARVHVITGAANPIQDIMQCLKKIGIEVEHVFPNAWAAAESVLSDEEKKLGALVIDIGKGTTEVAIYKENTLLATNSFRVGGGHIDNDLCLLLHVPLNYAEELKKNHGYCNYEMLAGERNPVLSEELDIFTPAGRLARKITVEEVSRIVTERTQDILDKLVKETVAPAILLPRLAGGVVITGGSARLKGLLKLSEQILGTQARIGVPRRITGIDRSLAAPAFSAGIGLLLLAAQRTTTPGSRHWWEMLWAKLRRKNRRPGENQERKW